MEHLSKTNYVSANLLLERKQRISRCHDVSGKELCSAAQKNDKDKEENCWNLRNKQGKASEERKKREGSDWKRQRSHIREKRNNKRQNEEEPISSSVQTSGVLKLSKVSILGPWCPTIPQTAQLPEKISLSIPPPAKAALDPPKPTSDSGPWAWPLFSSPPPDSLPPWILELPGKKNLLGKTIDDNTCKQDSRP